MMNNNSIYEGLLRLKDITKLHSYKEFDNYRRNNNHLLPINYIFMNNFKEFINTMNSIKKIYCYNIDSINSITENLKSNNCYQKIIDNIKKDFNDNKEFTIFNNNNIGELLMNKYDNLSDILKDEKINKTNILYMYDHFLFHKANMYDTINNKYITACCTSYNEFFLSISLILDYIPHFFNVNEEMVKVKKIHPSNENYYKFYMNFYDEYQKCLSLQRKILAVFIKFLRTHRYENIERINNDKIEKSNYMNLAIINSYCDNLDIFKIQIILFLTSIFYPHNVGRKKNLFIK